ncbi:UNVERIFIED_CONTAM: hypothetical protein Sindi_1433900 [Sesamum indicum]
MADSYNGGVNDSFEGNISLFAVARYVVAPPEQTLRYLNAPALALDPATLLVIANPLFYEQPVHCEDHQLNLWAPVLEPLETWYSIRKEVVELHQWVTKEALLPECGPFNDDIMAEKHLSHFRVPMHLPTYNSPTDPAKHLCKFDNAEKKKTLRAYVQYFNNAILKVPAAHQEMLINTLTQRFQVESLFESLAKKHVNDFYDLLAREWKFINLEYARLVKKGDNCDKRRDNEGTPTYRRIEESRRCFNPLNPRTSISPRL